MVQEVGKFEFWDKIKYIFSDPKLFFDKIKSEEGIKNSLLIYVIIGTFFSVIRFVLSLQTMSLLSRGYGDVMMYLSGIYLTLPFIILGVGVILTFLYSALIHVIMIAFKSEGSYASTYNVYTYSMIPYLILSVVPVVGHFSIIYSFILMIIGISEVHNISKGKSALAVLLPLVVMLGVLITLVIIFLLRMGDFPLFNL